MFIANNWKDYEVIDTSEGEKLERWGAYLLVRPDPQVIWNTPKKEKGWRKMNGHSTAAVRAAVNGSSLTCRSNGRFSMKARPLNSR